MQYLFIKRKTGEWLLSKKPETGTTSQYDSMFAFPSKHPSAFVIVNLLVKHGHITLQTAAAIMEALNAE